MANNVCIFPASQETAARAYAAGCDAHYAANYEPGGVFSYVREDLHKNWVTPHYAPPFDPDATGTFAEPPECFALREALGVIQTQAEYPENPPEEGEE